MSEEPAEAPAPDVDAPQGQGPNLAIYKSPELIESVVVFDPIGGRNLRFLDTMKIGAIGASRPVAIASARDPANFSKYVGYMPNGGYSAEDGVAAIMTDQKILEVCADISNQGGTTTRNLSAAATTPIQFRFDGIPLVLPRESYFEVTLEFVYVGPSFNIGQSGARNFIMGLLKSQGWARTASGLIQLVQAVDISATSFQTPDMTTQSFLEAVQTKDAEIDLRPDFYFNSYASFQKLSTEQKMKCTTVVDYINRFGNPKILSTQDEMMDFYGPDTAAVHVEPFSMPVTFRIPFAAISPVFKTNVLPLFMTNSTSINIQCQLQNPNIPFPLHSVMGDNPDMTPFLRTDGLNTNLGTTDKDGNAQMPLASYQQQNQIDRFLAVVSRAENGRDWYPDSLYDSWGFTPAKVSYTGVGGTLTVDRPGALWALPASAFVQPGPTYRSEYGTQQLFARAFDSTTGTPTLPNDSPAAMAFFDYSQQAAGPISPLGELQYCFWGAEFTMKAFVKTYASALNNPLVARYLRPYLVGPEGQPAFFRSAYLSYNFNAQTYTIPPGSSVPFNFNISQTLINVPMAFLMFAEINGEKPYLSSQIAGACTVPDAGDRSLTPAVVKADGTSLDVGSTWNTTDDTQSPDTVNTFIVGATKPTVAGATTPAWNWLTEKYGLLDVFHRSHYVIQSDLDIHTVQVSIGPSGWNLYQRPLDMAAMNEITLNTLTRYDPEMVWKERVFSQTRFYTGDAWACFDLSHDEYRGLFIDSDNMLNITGMFTNKNTTNSKIVYVQLVLPYIDHFIINTQDSTVTKSQL